MRWWGAHTSPYAPHYHPLVVIERPRCAGDLEDEGPTHLTYIALSGNHPSSQALRQLRNDV